MTSLRRLLVCLTITAFAMTVGVFAADEKKIPVKEIMKKVPGKNGLVSKTVTEAKAAKWDAAQKDAKQLVVYAEALSKNTPKKGDKESWDMHTKGVVEVMGDISAAAEKKDAEAVEASAKKFGTMCGNCHKAHK